MVDDTGRIWGHRYGFLLVDEGSQGQAVAVFVSRKGGRREDEVNVWKTELREEYERTSQRC